MGELDSVALSRWPINNVEETEPNGRPHATDYSIHFWVLIKFCGVTPEPGREVEPAIRLKESGILVCIAFQKN